MAKVEAAYIQINASSSYTLVRSNITYSDIKSSATYSNLSAAEVILDYDTKNRYFRDEEFTFEDLAALTPEKSFTDSVGAVSDVLQSVGVGKSAVETFGIGDFTHVLLTLQRSFLDGTSVSDVSTLTADVTRLETLITNETLSYDFSMPAADAATLSDIALLTAEPLKTDSLAVNDAFSRVITFSRAISDTFTLDDFTDVNAFTKDTVGSKSNALSFTETQAFTTQKPLANSATVSDSFSSHFIVAEQTDTTSMSDAITIQMASLASSVFNASAINIATLNN
jgi:hypothetical protein